jgi:hypothetical protein
VVGVVVGEDDVGDVLGLHAELAQRGEDRVAAADQPGVDDDVGVAVPDVGDGRGD